VIELRMGFEAAKVVEERVPLQGATRSANDFVGLLKKLLCIMKRTVLKSRPQELRYISGFEQISKGISYLVAGLLGIVFPVERELTDTYGCARMTVSKVSFRTRRRWPDRNGDARQAVS